MATRSLPTHPDLGQLRRQAKELRDAVRAGDPDATTRLRAYLSPGAQVTLSVAQRALAREYGFSSWPQLKAEVEARSADLAGRLDAFPVPGKPPSAEVAEFLLGYGIAPINDGNLSQSGA
ncbi:MAG TPA: hypothetical protein VF221_18660 [Chloroflexota bacterium]